MLDFLEEKEEAKRNNNIEKGLFYYSFFLFLIISICYTTRLRRSPFHITFYFYFINFTKERRAIVEKEKLNKNTLQTYITESFYLINDKLKRQQSNSNAKPLRKPQKKLYKKTVYNLQQLEKVLCGNDSKYENLRKLLKMNERYRILIDFFIVADSLKIDRKRKKATNKNKDIRFMNESGDYFFALPIDKFIELRGGTRSSISKNINLFVLLGFIGKVNPYEIEPFSVYQQEIQRQNKIAKTTSAVRKKEIFFEGKKIDYNFTTLYFVSKITNKKLKEADEKAKKLFENNFTIRAFTCLYIVKYFGVEESKKVYFHDNLLEDTEYSNFLQGEIKKAILLLVEKQGYANKKQVYKLVKDKCVAKNFEIPENKFAPDYNIKREYGRPRTSPSNTFETEYKRVLAEFLQKNKNIRLSSTPTKEMQEVFELQDKQHILYDINYLKERKQ